MTPSRRTASTPAGLPDLHHVGVVVGNCVAAADALAMVSGSRAMPPFEDRYDEILVSGRRQPFALQLSFLWLGNVLVELLQPLDEDSPHAEFLAEHGNGLHHLAFRVDDLAVQLSRLEALGMRRLVDATVAADVSHWVYLESPDDPGQVIELMQISPPNTAFFQMVDRALGLGT